MLSCYLFVSTLGQTEGKKYMAVIPGIHNFPSFNTILLLSFQTKVETFSRNLENVKILDGSFEHSGFKITIESPCSQPSVIFQK